MRTFPQPAPLVVRLCSEYGLYQPSSSTAQASIQQEDKWSIQIGKEHLTAEV
jgi:hypothetical protein